MIWISATLNRCWTPFTHQESAHSRAKGCKFRRLMRQSCINISRTFPNLDICRKNNRMLMILVRSVRLSSWNVALSFQIPSNWTPYNMFSHFSADVGTRFSPGGASKSESSQVLKEMSSRISLGRIPSAICCSIIAWPLLNNLAW